jgi:hypothetical protein
VSNTSANGQINPGVVHFTTFAATFNGKPPDGKPTCTVTSVS